MIDMPPQDEASTITCSTSVVGGKEEVVFDVSSSHTMESALGPQHEINETNEGNAVSSPRPLLYWSPDYEEAEHDEFLAFCFEGFNGFADEVDEFGVEVAVFRH